MRRISVLACCALWCAAPARAAAPVAIPGWNTTAQHAEAVDSSGRGLVVFPHGEHAWAASIAPDGSIAARGRIEAPRAVDGPNQLVAALDDDGHAVAGYVAYNGRQPRGPDGYGFVRRPWASRFAWGTPPAAAELIARGLIDVSALGLAMRRGGTALFVYGQDTVRTGKQSSRAAVLAPGRGPAVHVFDRLRGAWPTSTAVAGDGTFVTGWDDDRRLGVTRMDSAGRFGVPELLPAAERKLAPAPVLIDGAGNETVVWENPGGEVRLAARGAGARAFGAAAVVARGRSLVDAATGPSGHRAILVAPRYQRALELVRPGSPPVGLPGTASVAEEAEQDRSHFVAVASDGTALVAYSLMTSRTTQAARTVRVAPDGTVTVVEDAAGCAPLGLAGAPTGAGIVTLACTEGSRTYGAVQAIPPPAVASAARTRGIASGRGAGGLTAYGGHLVWSRRDGHGRWHLMHWHAGRVSRLPVPSRGVPFDADAGPDADGHPVVVFSRCTTDARYDGDWLHARGCVIQELRLDAPGAPHAVPGTDAPGTSATTPSRWGGAIAFARHTDRAFTSTVHVLRPGADAPAALPSAPLRCDVDCDDRRILTTVESLDLGPKAAAFVWRQDGGDTFGIDAEWWLQVDPLDGGTPSVLSDGFVDGACGYVYPFRPTARGLGAFWIAAGSPCSETETAFAESDPVTRRRREAHVRGGLVVGATRDATAAYWLRAKGARDDVFPSAYTCSEVHVSCTVMRSTALPWRALRRGEPLGPVPEEG